MSFVMIYHIATEPDWERRSNVYAPDGWRCEGFVHCSTDEQLVRVANHLFGGRHDLVLLHIDPARLGALLIWEDTAGAGEDFPHVYGPIETAAVVTVEPFPGGPDGTFDWWSPPG